MSVIVKPNSFTRKITAAALSLLLLLCVFQPSAAKADGPSAPMWKLTSGQDGLNVDPGQGARSPKTAVWNNQVYAIWAESVPDSNNMFEYIMQIRVKVLDGENWVPADGGNGLNVFPDKNANNPALAVYNGSLYAIWEEETAFEFKYAIRVKKYDGTNWITADGDVPLNGSGGNTTGQFPVLIAYKDYLYAAWMGNSNGSGERKIQVKKFDGSVWTTDASDLTFAPNGSVYAPQFALYNDNLYLTWSENTTSSPYLSYIPVFQKSGNTPWENISGASGLGEPTITSASPTLQAYKGSLYAVWRNSNTAQLLIKKYDGSAWSPVGSGILTTEGSAQQPHMAVFNGKLFLSWVEVNNYQMNPRVQKYDGFGWTATDDGLITGSDGSVDSLAATADALHILWSDGIAVRSAFYQEPPAAPTGLKAVAGDQEISLSWDSDSSGSDYKIYKGSAPGVYDPIPVATVSGAIGSYKVMDLVNGSSYYFAVKASNAIGESPYSNEVGATAGVLKATLLNGCVYNWTVSPEQALEQCGGNPLQAGTFVNYDYVNSVYLPRSTLESVLKFNLPVTNASIASAKLKLFATVKQVSIGADDISLILHKADPAWQPQNAGVGIPVAMPQLSNLSTPKSTVNQFPDWNEFDVTSLVLDSLDQNETSLTMVLEGTRTTDDALMSYFDFLYSVPGLEPVLELTVGSRPQPDPAELLTGLTWSPGSTAGTTQLTDVSGDPILRYVVGAPGQYTRPVAGADAAQLGYTQLLNLNADIAVTSGQHLYVVAVDSLGKIVKWADKEVGAADINPGQEPQTDPAELLTGLTWSPGSTAGTTKLTGVSGDPILMYAVGAPGEFTRPVAGADAAQLGYTQLLNLNADIAVTSGQHLFIVALDSLGKIVKWADKEVGAADINPGQEPQPDPAELLTGLTWSPGSTAGTTKLTGVSGDPILMYAVGAPGEFTRPVAGADAAQLGYTQLLDLNADIAVTNGQHLFIVTVDSLGKVVKWADAAIAAADIAANTPIYPSVPPVVEKPQDDGFAIQFNGGEVKDQTATGKVVETGGKKTTIVSIDPQKLSDKLASSPEGAVIFIPVRNGSDSVIGELSAQTVKAMESKNAVLKIETEQGGYTLPASLIDVPALLSQLGTNIDLSEITIRIAITNVPEQKASFLTKDGQNVQVIAPAVDFSITAVYQGREVKVDTFNAYVERTIAIPDGVDPSKITTGVVVLADGSILHVPTKVTQANGTYYAVINSLTNSVYSVIYNVKTFEDISSHWSKASIEDMASRLILNGTGNQFLPDDAITRAEFAAIMVRALGLSTVQQSAVFSDVSKSDWFYEAVSMASSYGLLQGYPDDSFRPDRSISRQEAMAITAKAMAIAGMETAMTPAQQAELLSSFRDAGQFGGWAQTAAALNIRYGVISGSGAQARPLDEVTRAETAAMIQRLLRQAGLI
ncbi:S-layer homology domain-containing protein [Paenibacillus nasutitermitis]|uniref:S-layer homology domain-containing protein n=1 Tax=Paenibacillus nasutitermitis TaxID=1652958 RepID=A0A916ZD81_9BACL|nr:S-layer homology domain-containing protein [Paenibacillus nasutitermitis]GGD89099.1 hypothetical protein GCM10010911_54620 [Paenibacillus nasutitermitis]